MIEKKLTIINKLGLHARAATKFANTAARYNSDIRIIFEEKKIDGKSIMSLMLLAASKGTTISICTDGDDEQDAMDALETLISNRFGEDE